MTEDVAAHFAWVDASIGDIVASDGLFTDGDWVETKDQDPNGTVRLIQLADIGDGNFLDKSARFLTRAKAHALNCTFLTKGDLLVARLAEPLGRCCIFPLDGDEEYVTVVDVCVVRLGTSAIDPKYVMYALNSPRTRAEIETHSSGSTRKRVSRRNLAGVTVPLAPRYEQRRIVAKIEELFSELDKGIESLKTARRQLEVYRQSVLKHAFEGKLTAQWREENKDKLETPERLLARVKKERVASYERELQRWRGAVKASRYSDKLSKKPAGPKKPEDVAEVSEDETAKLTRLPEGWLWVRVGSLLSERPANGRSVKDRLSGFPVLRLTAIKQEKLDLSEVKSGDWEREEALQYLVHEGDFLVARGNGSKRLVGRGALVPGVENDVAYPDTMIRLRVIREAVGESFFSYGWNSHMLRRQIEGAARTTAGIYKINQGHILDFLIPLCSKGEQTVVVNQLSEILSTIDKLEVEVDEQVSRFGALRQAILKKAFAGQLVAQDPNDEPASVLLEKIKTERAKADKKGPTGRKNRKADTAA